METSQKQNSSKAGAGSPARRNFPWWILFIAAGAVTAWAALAHQTSHGISPGVAAAADLPLVPAVKVDRENLVRAQTFDAEFRPYQVIDLHAEVAGFVRSINVDIGDQVQKGELLATLEIPELAEDIEHADATKHRDEKLEEEARAAYEDAHVTWTRLQAIDARNHHLVARQELDTARAKDAAADAAAGAAEQNVKVAQAALDKLRAVQDECKIVAPFSGVITKRYADVGALVQGGVSPSSAALPLVRLSENNRLRLDFPVSVSYVPLIKVGDPVEIRVTATGQLIHGKVSRFTHNVDMDTRTMETEVDVSNADLSITPGIYAEARLELERRDHALSIPTQSVANLDKPTVFTIGQDGIIQEKPLKLGLITPDGYEVMSGLGENEMVLIGNRSQVRPGQKVEVKLMERSALQ